MHHIMKLVIIISLHVSVHISSIVVHHQLCSTADSELQTIFFNTM